MASLSDFMLAGLAKVKSPISYLSTGSDVKDLQGVLTALIADGTVQLDDSNDDILAEFEQEKGNPRSASSILKSNPVLGRATASILRAMSDANQIVLGITNLIEFDTALALNALYYSTYTVEGNIYNANLKAIAGATINIYDVAIRSRNLMANATTDVNGYFSVTFSMCDVLDDMHLLNIQIDVIHGGATDTSVIYFNAGRDTNIQFQVVNTETGTVSYQTEFQELNAKIGLVAPGVTLNLDDANFLTNELNETEQLINAYINGAIFHTNLSAVDQEFFYGLLRQNLPSDYNVIILQTDAALRTAIQLSMATNIVKHFTSGEVDAAIAAIINASAGVVLNTSSGPAESAKTYHLLNISLDNTDIQNVFNAYSNQTYVDGVWNHLEDIIADPTQADKVRISVNYSLLTGNNPGMVHYLIDHYPTTPPTGLSAGSWSSAITSALGTYASTFVFPPHLTGSTSDKTTAYASQLKNNFDTAFPSHYLNTVINADSSTPFSTYKTNLSTFTAIPANANFDLKTTPSTLLKRVSSGFDFTGISDKEAFINDIGTVQRLSAYTTDYTLISALATAGITSSREITAMDRGTFVTTFGTSSELILALPGIYDRAILMQMYTHAIAGNIYASYIFNVPSIYSQDSTNANPDLATLFGSLDYCTCEECVSVYSAAAYLVDTLELLRKNNPVGFSIPEAYNILKARRPDLWNISLNCENTNTPLPYIDLVNELLEDLMNPAYQDLAHPLAYTLTAHDTTLTAEEVNAIPEYLDYHAETYSPYDTLASAYYPWTLPYNYYNDKVNKLLKLIDVDPYKVQQTFSTKSVDDSFMDVTQACTYLGITINEYAIITDTSTVGKYYGTDAGIVVDPADTSVTHTYTNATFVAVLAGRVDIFLQQTGLQFNDLLQLLECYYINAASLNSDVPPKVVRHLNIIGDPLDSCQTNKLTIANLGLSDLKKIHRFVRLARKCGWSFYDLDKVIYNYVSNSQITIDDFDFTGDFVKYVAQLKKISKTFNANIDALLILWGDVPYYRYRNFDGDNPVVLKSRYEIIFKNISLKDFGYRFADTANGIPVIGVPDILDPVSPLTQADQTGAFIAALNISGDDYNLLTNMLFSVLPPDYISFTFENMNKIYREVNFARLIRCSISDWCTYRQWLINIGFVFDTPITPLSFISLLSKIKIIRGAGLTIKQISYLFENIYVGAQDADGHFIDRDSKIVSILTLTDSLRTKLLKEQDYSAATDTDGKILSSKLTALYAECNKQRTSINDPLNLPFTSVEINTRINFIMNYVGLVTYDPVYEPVDAPVLHQWIGKADPANFPDQPPVGHFNYISGDSTTLAGYLEEIGVETDVANTAASDLIQVAPLIASATTIEERLTILFNAIILVDLKSQVQNFISSSFKIDTLIAETILNFLSLDVAAPLFITGDMEITDSTTEINGTGTSFLTELTEGMDLYTSSYVSEATFIGTIDSITDDTHAALTAPATANYSGPYFYFEGPVSDVLTNQIYITDPLVIVTDPLAITSESTPDSAKNPFVVLAKIEKICALVNIYNLGADDITVLYQYYDELGIPNIFDLAISNPWDTDIEVEDTLLWYKFMEWMTIRGYMDKNAPYSNTPGLLTIFGNSLAATGVTNQMIIWGNLISYYLQISIIDLSNLADSAVLNISLTTLADIFTPATYTRLFDCIDQKNKLQSDIPFAIKLAKDIIKKFASDDGYVTPNTLNDSTLVLQLVKANYEENEWLEILKPANDKLRLCRKNAMVAYLLANPVFGYKNKWFTSNDIYDTLMIDVEMMPCMMTSRIRQAMSTVQLFVERCLLHLEVSGDTLIILQPETVRQWNTWRRFYRVWEANRMVFLYPENWIEPELRDDKTPFFTELEKYLKQNEVIEENVEEAYTTYLERLDDVSKLDIIGTYFDETNHVVHAWGRTRRQPHLYYYRFRKDNEWKPWVKMDTQIDGNHFVPVIWRGRLRLYWLSFIPKTKIYQGTDDDQNVEKMNPSGQYQYPLLSAQLCWTEFKSNKWTAKTIGKEELDFDPIYKNGFDLTNGTYPDFYFDYAKENLEFYGFRYNGELQFGLTTRRVDYINDWKFTEKDVDYGNPPGTYKGAPPFYNVGQFLVQHDSVFAQQATDDLADPPPSYYETLVLKGNLQRESRNFTVTGVNDGYTHEADYLKLKLFYTSPGFDQRIQRYILLQRARPEVFNNLADTHIIPLTKFFYSDYKNSFYAEKMPVPFINQSTAESAINVGKEIAPAMGSGTFALGAVSNVSSVSNNYLVKSSMAVGNFPQTNTTTFKANAIDAVQVFAFDPNPQPPYKTHLDNNDPTLSYRFQSFYYYRVNDLSANLFNGGIDGLLDYTNVSKLYGDAGSANDGLQFVANYNPTIHVVKSLSNDDTTSAYPADTLDFDFDSSYGIYNWEIFFHIPLLIANKLMLDQQFEDARKWFHYIFDPTSTLPGGPERFWNFIPFKEESLKGIPTLEDIMKDPHLEMAVQQWANNPFDPHLVARNRISAYMRNVVMKYLDNLIAWADTLFRQDTMETINEATLLYVLAAKILGKPPVKIPQRIVPTPESYQYLLDNGGFNAFSNATVEVETLVGHYGFAFSNNNNAADSYTQVSVPYFCMPPNDKLLSYWGVVADRLYKIRHCQNIDGVVQQLALFDPPIDPGLLVNAAANGVSIGDALNDIMSPLPQYRFNVMQQKAVELTQEVKSFGSTLLSALEKKDAEHISLLRSSQEINVLQAARDVKVMQLDEAKAQIEVLGLQQKMVEARKAYYDGLVATGLIDEEKHQLSSMNIGLALKIAEQFPREVAAVLHLIPDFKLGAPTSLGATFGGGAVGKAIDIGGDIIRALSAVEDFRGSMGGIKASQKRRAQDWGLQQTLAQKELDQIAKQVSAAQIRQQIAQTELANHDLQIKNATDMDAAMHDKFTNEDLYDWMISQISLTYFQVYKLAFDVAKRAERCYRYELGIVDSNFITFGYWDSLRKGLLAGEGLIYDLKRMDISYMDQNKRQHEMTKHISLASFDSESLMLLKQGKATTSLEFPEWLFDMDYPGHYNRRIKSVSVSIPCIAGPYVTVSAKLTLNSSRIRKTTIGADSETLYTSDNGLTYLFGGGQSIATSNAQNDSGLFEFNFRDERYLPFEGHGAYSFWTLELPAAFPQFDYNTISDVIFHIKYTADYDGVLAGIATTAVGAELEAGIAGKVLPRVFNLKNEFATEWYAYLNNIASPMSFTLNHKHFPFFALNKTITITSIFVQIKYKADPGVTNDNIKIDSDTHLSSAQDLSALDAGFKTLAYVLTTPLTIGVREDLPIDFKFGVDSGTFHVDYLNSIDTIAFVPIYTIS